MLKVRSLSMVLSKSSVKRVLLWGDRLRNAQTVIESRKEGLLRLHVLNHCVVDIALDAGLSDRG
jgi:hypothetical protein